MNKIDRVTLYPFSPLKLLHETRKMTAAQAKFFVALMCLYFERHGALDWYGGEEEKHAALYAPYCGVTKKTFMKMINVLQAAGVVYINDCGQITPIIAQEIREAVKSGSHTITTCDETDAGVKVEAIIKREPKADIAVGAQEQKREEGGKVVSAEMFRGQEGAEAEDYQSDAGRGEPVDDVLEQIAELDAIAFQEMKDKAMKDKAKVERKSLERLKEIERINALAVEKARELDKDDDWFDDEAKFDVPYEERKRKAEPMAKAFYDEARRQYLEDERMPEYYANGMAAQDTFNMLCKSPYAYDFAMIDAKQYWRETGRTMGAHLDEMDERMMKKGMVWDKDKLKFVKKGTIAA